LRQFFPEQLVEGTEKLKAAEAEKVIEANCNSFKKFFEVEDTLGYTKGRSDTRVQTIWRQLPSFDFWAFLAKPQPYPGTNYHLHPDFAGVDAKASNMH